MRKKITDGGEQAIHYEDEGYKRWNPTRLGRLQIPANFTLLLVDLVDQNLTLSSQTLALSPPQTTRTSHTGRDRLGLPLGPEMEVFRKPHKAAEYCKQLLFQPTI